MHQRVVQRALVIRFGMTGIQSPVAHMLPTGTVACHDVSAVHTRTCPSAGCGPTLGMMCPVCSWQVAYQWLRVWRVYQEGDVRKKAE
jgi:hypothetical protein